MQVMRSQSQVALKSRLQCQNEADKKKHRSKLGMLEDANEITVRQTLDEKIRQGVQTTKQLVDTRFKLDHKDIHQKTVSG